MAVAFTQGQCYGRPDGTNHPSAATHTRQQHPRTQPNRRLPSLTESPLQGYQAERSRDRSSKQTIWVKLPSRTRDRSAILVQQRFRIALPPGRGHATHVLGGQRIEQWFTALTTATRRVRFAN